MARSLINQFMEAVLGDEAATALSKAADQSTSIDTVLGPRTILGWLNLVSRWGFEGQVPGMPGSYLAFGKAESSLSGGFTGELRWGKHVYDFERQDVTHIAAALSCALEVDKPVAKSLRDGDLASLGENIDLLIKTQLLNKANDDEGGTYQLPSDEMSQQDDEIEEEMARSKTDRNGALLNISKRKAAKKFEAPGGHAKQRGFSGFGEPEGQTAKAPSRNGRRKVKLTRSQSRTRCSVCDAPQFSGDVFTACFCLRDLAKHAEAETDGNGFMVTFDKDYWTASDVSVFLDIVSGHER